MVAAVGVHVIDEAVTGFLPFYNGLVLQLRERWAWFPAPTYTFSGWITGLTLGVAGAFALTPLVARGGPVMRAACGVFAALMLANGLAHTLGSVYFGSILPGFWSSPFVVASSAWMLMRVGRAAWPADAA